MNLVAIDPSFRNMAFVFAKYENDSIEVTDYHLEQTQRIDEGSRRNDDWRVARDLADTVRAFTWNADYVFIEQPVGSQSARSAWTLGITLGLMAAIEVPVFTLSARQVKLGFTGNPKASKAEIIAKAAREFHYVQLPKHGKKINSGKAEHICDALACLYVGVQSREFKEVLEECHLTT